MKPNSNGLIVTTDIKAQRFPVLRVLLRTDIPCLSSSYTPGDENSFFRDELRRYRVPCPRLPYFETSVDTRYDFVQGNLSLDLETFEQENGLSEFWAGRYSDGQPENNLIRQFRKER